MEKYKFTAIGTAAKQLKKTRANFAKSGFMYQPVIYKLESEPKTTYGFVALFPGKMAGYAILEGDTMGSEIVQLKYNKEGVLIAQ